EVVRDIALAASGLLNPQLGGPSVHPPAPAFLFSPPASYGPKGGKEGTGPGRFRRGSSTFRLRPVPAPPPQNFDSPNGDFSCVRRVRSNTPLQALTTLNEPVFLECAQALARRVLEQGGDTEDQRLAYAFRLCVARLPTDREKAVLRGVLDKQRSRFTEGGAKPEELVAKQAMPSGATARQLGAWTVVSRVLLNLDETITKE